MTKGFKHGKLKWQMQVFLFVADRVRQEENDRRLVGGGSDCRRPLVSEEAALEETVAFHHEPHDTSNQPPLYELYYIVGNITLTQKDFFSSFLNSAWDRKMKRQYLSMHVIVVGI